MRIGHGFDVHRLGPDRRLVLGGVEIPFELGLLAHSDGDVLVHALCDALLGAAALGDLGRYFPDSSDEWRNADSRLLLRRVVSLLAQHGLVPGNVDATVIAERPKLAPYVDGMRANLADDLDLAVERVSVKATTSEGLGFTGRGEGIAAHAVVLLEPHGG